MPNQTLYTLSLNDNPIEGINGSLGMLSANLAMANVGLATLTNEITFKVLPAFKTIEDSFHTLNSNISNSFKTTQLQGGISSQNKQPSLDATTIAEFITSILSITNTITGGGSVLQKSEKISGALPGILGGMSDLFAEGGTEEAVAGTAFPELSIPLLGITIAASLLGSNKLFDDPKLNALNTNIITLNGNILQLPQAEMNYELLKEHNSRVYADTHVDLINAQKEMQGYADDNLRNQLGQLAEDEREGLAKYFHNDAFKEIKDNSDVFIEWIKYFGDKLPQSDFPWYGSPGMHQAVDNTITNYGAIANAGNTLKAITTPTPTTPVKPTATPVHKTNPAPAKKPGTTGGGGGGKVNHIQNLVGQIDIHISHSQESIAEIKNQVAQTIIAASNDSSVQKV